MLILDTEVGVHRCVGVQSFCAAGRDYLAFVSGTTVFVAGRRWILNSAELGVGFELSVALVSGGNVYGGRVASDFSNLVHIGVGCLSKTD